MLRPEVADIFISYQPERRAAAAHLATMLRLYGYSVWFEYDQAVGPAHAFDQGPSTPTEFGRRIDRELQQARAVVVLWCSMSRKSDWVREEAQRALQRGALVSTRIEPVDVPGPFYGPAVIDLSGWDGAPQSSPLAPLLGEIADRVGRLPKADPSGLGDYEEHWRQSGGQALSSFELGAPIPMTPVFPPAGGSAGLPPGSPSPGAGPSFGAPAGGPSFGGPVGSPYGAPPTGRAPTYGTPPSFPPPGTAGRPPPPAVSAGPNRGIYWALALAFVAIVAVGAWVTKIVIDGIGSPPSREGMVMVPAGSFFMGCDNEGVPCEPNETPGRSVYVGAFWIDETEVTVAQYEKCVEAGGCSTQGLTIAFTDGQEQPVWSDHCNYGRVQPNNDQHPINCVTWEHARVYCDWAGKRLPTEEEWEKAARGTDRRIYPWGNTIYSNANPTANVADQAAGRLFKWDFVVEGYDDGFSGSAPVGSFSPLGDSPYGAKDMSGNLAEWTDGWLEVGRYRSLRGASWVDNYAGSTTHYPDGQDPLVRSVGIGFRCARSNGS